VTSFTDKPIYLLEDAPLFLKKQANGINLLLISLMTHLPQRVILIIEDFHSDSDLCQRCLSALDCRYTILENSLESALAPNRSFALQSLDCILLSSNGLTGLAQLSDQMGDRCPPIVMIADNENVTIAVQAIKQGAEDYLIKHKTTPDQLQMAIQTAIANAELKQKSQRSEERFRTSVENMLDCFGIYSAIRDQIGQIIDFRIDYLNAAALESTCLTPDDIGKPLYDVLPNHRDGQFAKYCQVVETGQPLVEKSLIYSDVFGNEHSTRVYDLHVSQLEDGFVAAWRDVTERKQSEAELRTLNERFKLAATAVKCLIYDWDLQTNLVTRPFGFTELLGYRPEEVEPTREWWQQCIHPDDASQLRDRYRINLETADRYMIEYRVRHRDGHYLWVQDQGVVLRDEANRPARIVGTTIDIDDRKQAESALRRSQERLQHMVNTAQVGIAFATSMGEILEINHALLQMLGYSREEFLDQTLAWQAVSLLESDPSAPAPIEQLGTSGSTTKELIHKDGWRVPSLVSATRLKGEADEYVVFVLDISEQRRLEQERLELLTREQAARAEAELANRTKDEFLEIVSHELRSPLNAIYGWAKLLRTRTYDAATIDRALETIERNAQTQTQLIEDLLDVSRMIRGNLRLDLAPMSLAPVIDVTIANMRLAAEAKSIQLHSQTDGSIGYVLGDPNRLQQIVTNLLTNAVKFTPQHGCVHVSLKQIGGQAQIQVADTGKGIQPDFLPYVFERFRQADGGTTGSKDGLGLGLAIVRHLVELHSGTITADSPGEGQGATFTVKIPVLDDESKRIKNDDKRENKFDLNSSLLSNVSVLVVDDEPDTREFLTVALEGSGARVTTAESVRSAFEMFQQTQPDLIVSDIGMPEEDGYTLLSRIRQLASELRNTPAIALTAHAKPEDRDRALDAGFQDHLTKPVEPDNLIRAIVHLLRP